MQGEGQGDFFKCQMRLMTYLELQKELIANDKRNKATSYIVK